MYQKLLYCSLILFLSFACSKDKVAVDRPAEKEKSFEIYYEAVEEMKKGDYFYASKKFIEAENILPRVEYASKALIMSSYCLYLINFYDEAISRLESYIKKYPASQDIQYAYYLIAISTYEQILDEKKDLTPLLKSKKNINFFLEKYSESEYSLDLKFKLDLINNQLAAKELYVAKYYIETKKWIPAINRLKIIVTDYNETIFIEEALHRLVETYYKVGLVSEAESAAKILGYNYNSSAWYQQSYKVLNKDYKAPKIKHKKNKTNLISKTIKKILD